MKGRSARRRNAIVWTPEWTQEYKGWTAKFLRHHKWRVEWMHDMDDLMQDAWMVFSKLKDTYPRVVEPALFFALYKRAMINKINDRSCFKTRRKDIQVPMPADDADFLVGRIGEAGNAGYVASLLGRMSPEVKEALHHLIVPEQRESKSRRKMVPRENLSMRLCRVMGLPEGTDPVSDLKKLLSE